MEDAPDPVPLSALQHWQYCPRQCGLIHLEQVFGDTLPPRGGAAGQPTTDRRVVKPARGSFGERALRLWHAALVLIGKSDVVDFLPDGPPSPVEYKHGSRHKAADIAACDDLQLTAQALCLESMLGKPVHEGALYYASSKRRRVVRITPQLRADVARTAGPGRQMLASGQLPPPLMGEQAARRCKACSLIDRCQPHATHAGVAAARAALYDPDA